MKRISMKTTFGLAVALLTTACTNELADKSANGTKTISFQIPQTEARAAVNNADDMANGFEVWGWYKNETSGPHNVFNGVTVSKKNGSWGYDEQQYWSPGYTYNFYGVYPTDLQDVTVSSAGKIEVKNFDCSATGNAAIDLMTATSEPNLSGDAAPTVEMNFGHELSRLKFTVKAEDGVTATVTNAKLYGVIYKADYSSSDNTCTNPYKYSDTNTKFTYTSDETPQPLPSEGIDNLFSDILIIPNDNLEGVVFELTYYYDEYSQVPTTKKIMVKTDLTPNWEKGKNYTYTVTIGPNNIQFQPIVTPWNHSTGGIITVE